MNQVVQPGFGQNNVFGEFVLGSDVGLLLTYEIPLQMISDANRSEQAENLRGRFFVVPLRGKVKIALLLRIVPKPEFKCLLATELLEEQLRIPATVLQLLAWAARYYLCAEGRAYALAAPGFLWNASKLEQRKKRLAKNLSKGFVTKIRGEGSNAESLSSSLTAEQKNAVEKILHLETGTAVLFGVTGSGKTEVYLEVARGVLQRNKNVLVMVPEIALTPQMSVRFRRVFGEELAVLHSGLTSTDYEKEWHRIQLGMARVVLGVRSAVFCPLQNIGLIVVDEEHDGSYKCEEMPCYHARDVAVKRAHLERGVCVLGSATPSVESYFNVQKKRYELVCLANKFSGVASEVEFVDCRLYSSAQAKGRRQSSLVAFDGQTLTPPIIEALQRVKAKNEQAILIINRRGFANYAACKACGASLSCPNCSVSTTLHNWGKRELCHYCGFTRTTLLCCPTCGGDELVQMGTGTQNVEGELASVLPNFKVARLDRDVLTSNTRLSEILNSFRNGETDGLVGTQILSKGHDFPRVSLVILLHLEEAMLLPDYRSFERSFQLITQSCGRAGRGKTEGRVMLQSLLPPNLVMEQAVKGETLQFLQEELERRAVGCLPPYVRHIQLEFKDSSEERALQAAFQVKESLKQHWAKLGILQENIRIAGPVPAIIEKLKENFRFHMCISLAKELPHWQLFEPILEEAKLQRAVRIDVDPLSYI